MNRLVYVKNVVIRGFGRGSKELGCPTANVDGIDHLTIPTGIYCGLVQLVIETPDQVQEEPGNKDHFDKILDSLPYVSPVSGMVLSFGYNPQYGNKNKSLEVHILDNFKFNFYGAELRVLICKKLRDEEKYTSLNELKQAIANDIKNATAEVRNFKHLATDNQYFLQPQESSRTDQQHCHYHNNNSKSTSNKTSNDMSDKTTMQNGTTG